MAVAFWLVGRRDVGTGLVAERLGRPAATARLTGLVALTTRRQLGAMLAWGFGIVVMGAFVGLLVGALVEFIASDPTFADALPIGPGGVAASALSLYTVFLATTTAAYAVTAIGAARAEEVASRGATVLALPVSRWRWLGSQVTVAGVASRGDHAGHGPGDGRDSAASLADGTDVGDLVGAAAVTLPAIGCVLGLAVLLLGLVPRAFAVIWAYLAYVFVVGLFGQLLPDARRRPLAVHVHAAAARRAHGLAARDRPEPGRRGTGGRRPGRLPASRRARLKRGTPGRVPRSGGDAS